jgi:FdhD protein
VLTSLPERLLGQQPGFALTGALHAAALCTSDGTLVCVREDIGRHNAVDKIVGWAARDGFPLNETCLVVSGRCSFEVVQKALAARIPCVVAVGGVSSLAVKLADTGGITLMGFTKAASANIYSHAERVT